MTVTIQEAKDRLVELTSLADHGEVVTIVRQGQTPIQLVPLQTDRPKRIVAEPKAGKRVGGQNLLGVTILDPNWAQPLSAQEAEEWGF